MVESLEQLVYFYAIEADVATYGCALKLRIELFLSEELRKIVFIYTRYCLYKVCLRHAWKLAYC